MTDLSNVVRMLIHQLDATRSYLLPSYCDEDEKARAVIAFAESALAAEPPAPAPAADGEREELAQWFDEEAKRCAAQFHDRITRAATLLREPAPAPVPGPTIDDIWGMCEDHEFHLGEGFDDEASAEIMLQIIRVALTRWGRPVPVPVAERPWERPGWCDVEGRCWWGRCADEVFNPEWALAPHADIKEFCSDAMPQHCLPHWAIPQPPQGGEVEPAPATDTRNPECVAAWPECYDGGYDPSCCRFPKSCSCGGQASPQHYPPHPHGALNQ